MQDRLARLMRPTVQDVRPPELKIKYFPAAVSLGGFLLNTNATGALEAKPVAAPEQTPAVSVSQPVSLVSDISGLQVVSSAEFGGRVTLSDLLNKMLDIPISVAGLEMPIRSLFGQLFSRIAAEEAATADLSGVRIPAVLNEVVNNASLDEARAAAQALKDAAQDASGVLVELAAASAAADITAVAGRVTALENAPAFDATAITGRLDAAEAAIGGKADQSAVDAALAGKAAAADLTALDGRVGVAETAVAAAGTRLDAVEAGVASKVAQADYDVYVAANDAAVAAAASAASAAASDAAAAQALAEAAEVKGYVSKLVVEDISTAGISGAYWAETIGAAIATALDAGKLVNYIFDAPAGEITIPAGTPASGAVRRLRNGHASAVLPIALGGVSYELVAGEIGAFQYDGAAWRLI